MEGAVGDQRVVRRRATAAGARRPGCGAGRAPSAATPAARRAWHGRRLPRSPPAPAGGRPSAGTAARSSGRRRWRTPGAGLGQALGQPVRRRRPGPRRRARGRRWRWRRRVADSRSRRSGHTNDRSVSRSAGSAGSSGFGSQPRRSADHHRLVEGRAAVEGVGEHQRRALGPPPPAPRLVAVLVPAQVEPGAGPDLQQPQRQPAALGQQEEAARPGPPTGRPRWSARGRGGGGRRRRRGRPPPGETPATGRRRRGGHRPTGRARPAPAPAPRAPAGAPPPRRRRGRAEPTGSAAWGPEEIDPRPGAGLEVGHHPAQDPGVERRAVRAARLGLPAEEIGQVGTPALGRSGALRVRRVTGRRGDPGRRGHEVGGYRSAARSSPVAGRGTTLPAGFVPSPPGKRRHHAA